jgi:hypothetical protein
MFDTRNHLIAAALAVAAIAPAGALAATRTVKLFAAGEHGWPPR